MVHWSQVNAAQVHAPEVHVAEVHASDSDPPPPSEYQTINIHGERSILAAAMQDAELEFLLLHISFPFY